jgi:tetratricopeptide (TPR) repeat protein
VQSPGSGPIDVAVDTVRLTSSRATRAEQEAAAAHAIAVAVRPERRQLPDAESTDARLREALEALTKKPTAAAHIRVAREYHRLKVFDDAISHFDAAVDLERRNAPAFEGRARVWRDTGLLAQALADANRAIYFAPGTAGHRNTLGTILEALGQFEQARLAYERTLTLDPGAGYAEENLRELPLRMATREPRRTP